VVPNLKPDNLLLDAGAGFLRYKNKLAPHAKYVATDFEQVFAQHSKDKLDFICSLDDIPQPDNTYDVIVNTQVLEHVEYPQKVINELYRVLKPGGTLYLTTCQTYYMHAAPYCFFFFTKYGLESLFKHAGFVDVSVRPRGGLFWVLAKFIGAFPSMLYYQYAYDGHKLTVGKTPKLRSPILALLLAPFFVVADFIFGRIIPFILFFVDALDRQKYYTLGYACIVKKPL
jgi:SAM-dependent methyltransferase